LGNMVLVHQLVLCSTMRLDVKIQLQKFCQTSLWKQLIDPSLNYAFSPRIVTRSWIFWSIFYLLAMRVKLFSFCSSLSIFLHTGK